MADKRKNKRMMDNYKFKPETTDQVPTEPCQETIVIEHTAETLPQEAFKAETIDVQAQYKTLPIPRGTIAYEITEKDGKTYQGFNKPAGVQEIKKYTEMTGGTMQIFETETTIQVPIGYNKKFGTSQKCKNC